MQVRRQRRQRTLAFWLPFGAVTAVYAVRALRRALRGRKGDKGKGARKKALVPQ